MAAARITTVERITGMLRGTVATTAPAVEPMGHTAARTMAPVTTPTQEPMRAARPPPHRMVRRERDKLTTHTPEDMARPIKPRMLMGVPEARPSQRTAKQSIHNIIRMAWGASEPQRRQAATSMRQRTVMFTGTPEAGGRRIQAEAGTMSRSLAVSALTMRTVGEAALLAVIVADHHQRSAVGAATPAKPAEEVGVHAFRARAAGRAAAAAADGVVATSAAVVSAVAGGAVAEVRRTSDE